MRLFKEIFKLKRVKKNTSTALDFEAKATNVKLNDKMTNKRFLSQFILRIVCSLTWIIRGNFGSIAFLVFVH